MSLEYNAYLDKHIENVKRSLSWLKSNLPYLVSSQSYDKADYNINLSFGHDASKWTKDEYDAYDKYFYGGNKSYDVVTEFNKAWLHHIHNNPHHWQHWVLLEDDPDGGNVCIEIPEEYVIEMICDWWSFSWNTGNLYEIFDWYDKHKLTMQLNKKTRKLVEDILDKIKKKLDESEVDKNVA